MATALSMVNEALVRIGAEPLASMAEQTAQATAANAVYSNVTRRLMADHFWSFAIRESLLGQISIPDNQRRLVFGKYIYQLPVDTLRVVGLRDFDYFELAADQMYTDASQAQCLYVAAVDESMWPAWFVNLVVMELAAALAISVTDSSSRADTYLRQAQVARTRARGLDSQQTPPVVFDLLRLYTAHRNNPLAGTG